MNALLVTEYFPPVTGGSPRWYDVIIRNARNFRWTVVTRPVEGAPPFERIGAHQVFRPSWWVVPPSPLKISTMKVYLRLYTHLREFARRMEPGVIHGMPVYGAALPALLVAQERRIPFVAHVCGEEFGMQGRSLYRRQVMKHVLGHADATVAISEATRSEAVKHGSAEASTHLIFVIDLSSLHPVETDVARAELGISGDPILLTVSRIVERKGHDSVVRALKVLLGEFPGLGYYIAGEGPDRPRIEELARAEGVAHAVHFLGRVPDEKLSALYSAADLFVMPNRELPSGEIEGWGMVFLEAGACGTPSIGGRSGGTGSAVEDGITGLLVDPLDAEGLSGTIARLLRDTKERERMGRAARDHALKVSSVAEAIQKLEALPGEM